MSPLDNCRLIVYTVHGSYSPRLRGKERDETLAQIYKPIIDSLQVRRDEDMKTMHRQSAFHITKTIAIETWTAIRLEIQNAIALLHNHTSMTKHDVVKEDKYHGWIHGTTGHAAHPSCVPDKTFKNKTITVGSWIKFIFTVEFQYFNHQMLLLFTVILLLLNTTFVHTVRMYVCVKKVQIIKLSIKTLVQKYSIYLRT